MAHQSVSDYLHSKGLSIQDKGKELITRCIFNDCDKDSHGTEAHLYINAQTGQYQCKKCMAEWNLHTIMKHYGDDPKEQDVEGYNPEPIITNHRVGKKKETLTEKDVEKYHAAIPDTIRDYLHSRWITDTIINERKLGYGSFNGQNWIVIPLRTSDGQLHTLKLRREPSVSGGNKYMYSPSGGEVILYGEQLLEGNDDFIVICEGEFDQMVLFDQGLVSITSTGWSSTFKDVWVEKLQKLKEVYICYDNDEAGKAGALKLAKKIKIRFPHLVIKNITIPDDKWKDISEYFCNWGTRDALLEEYCEEILGVNASEFPPMYTREIIEVLSDTIKHDDINKVLVFLAMVSAFTDGSQINILLNAPSSSGKTFIPTEIANFFPEESIMELQYVSQQAFFHEKGEFNKETNENHIDLSRKIIIFLDQPRSELLARLRPLLSHDNKTLTSKITDKNGKGSNNTKTIVIHWFPVVIFCTASPELDEQEATRFLLLSPETTQKKLHASISSKIIYESNKVAVKTKISENPKRLDLKNRLVLIRDAHIDDVNIEDHTPIDEIFLNKQKDLQPRDQRDVPRVTSLIKAFTLLNFADRRREGNILYASQRDIEEGIALWNEISVWQQLGISPSLLEIYRSVFLPAFIEHNILNKFWTDLPNPLLGIKRVQVTKKHLQVMGRKLWENTWRLEIEPALANAGLIHKEMERGTILLYPTEDISNLIQ